MIEALRVIEGRVSIRPFLSNEPMGANLKCAFTVYARSARSALAEPGHPRLQLPS